jgi:hypothetical protein
MKKMRDGTGWNEIRGGGASEGAATFRPAIIRPATFSPTNFHLKPYVGLLLFQHSVSAMDRKYMY